MHIERIQKKIRTTIKKQERGRSSNGYSVNFVSDVRILLSTLKFRQQFRFRNTGAATASAFEGRLRVLIGSVTFPATAMTVARMSKVRPNTWWDGIVRRDGMPFVGGGSTAQTEHLRNVKVAGSSPVVGNNFFVHRHIYPKLNSSKNSLCSFSSQFFS